MKSLLLVLSVLIVACVAHEFQAIHDLAWAGWKEKYNRTYAAVEEEYRRKIWENNLVYIEEFNAQELSYKLGPNHFADLTNLEYRQISLGYDNEARLNSKREKTEHECTMREEDIPTSVDWRTKGLVTPVKNQGQCGSCWSFSATGSLEGQYAKKTGSLVSFSEQELVDCSTSQGNHGCQGGLMDYAFEYLKKYLEEKESDYPYTAKNGECKYDSSKGVTKDSSYVDVPSRNCDALKEAVATIGPISVAIDASHSSFQLYKSGIYDPIFCSATRLDHGVLVVGYGVEDSKDYWLVKNSWGPNWGMDGYFKMRNKNNKCGVCTSASYPVF